MTAAEPGSNLPDRQALLVRWGLITVVGKDPGIFRCSSMHAPKTAIDKASFKAAMRHRRILIPASGFYEWQPTDKESGEPSQAYWIRPKNGGLVAFAGLMETWAAPDGSEIDTGAILTTHANADIAHIHDRMPVVIRPEDFTRWLDCRTQEPRDVADLMVPAQRRLLRSHRRLRQGEQGGKHRRRIFRSAASSDRRRGSAARSLARTKVGALF